MPRQIFQCAYKDGIGFIVDIAADAAFLWGCEGMELCLCIAIYGHTCPQYGIDWNSVKLIWRSK